MKQITIQDLKHLIPYVSTIKALKKEMSDFDKKNKNLHFMEGGTQFDEMEFQLLNYILSDLYLLCPINVQIDELRIEREESAKGLEVNSKNFSTEEFLEIEEDLCYKKYYIQEPNENKADNIFSSEMNFLKLTGKILDLFEDNKFASTIISTYFIRNALQHMRHCISNPISLADKFGIGITDMVFMIEYPNEENHRPILDLKKMLREREGDINFAGSITVKKELSKNGRLVIMVSYSIETLFELVKKITICFKDSIFQLIKRLESPKESINEGIGTCWSKGKIVEQLKCLIKTTEEA